jgi:hypothetical protein
MGLLITESEPIFITLQIETIPLPWRYKLPPVNLVSYKFIIEAVKSIGTRHTENQRELAIDLDRTIYYEVA